MMTKEDVARVYRMMLKPPYMKDKVNIKGKISRKAVLLLSHVVDAGITLKKSDKSGGLLSHLPDEVFDELKALSDEFLNEAQLIETSEDLAEMNAEK